MTTQEKQNINQEDITTKHKSKDSVFVSIFEDKENILRLYKELHPEDTAVTVDDIRVQTLKSVLVNTLYNDLGFIVNEGENAKYVLLVEAQSAWNPNMTLRMLFYIAETLRHFVKQSGQSLHLESRVKLPKIELYVVYTGNRKVPDEISFSEDYFNGDSPVDLRLKILSTPDTTIYGQYISFCKVYNEQRKLYDNSIKCIEETIRICIEKGYLADYLGRHKKEVVTMMAELFDEQTQLADYNAAREKEIKAEGRAEGKAEGIIEGTAKGIIEGTAKGKAEKAIEIALNLLSFGTMSKEDVSRITGLTFEKVNELAAQTSAIPE